MCNGKQHDFNLFKESRVQFLPTIKVFADSGYQGINKLHKNTEIPKKKTKETSLSSQDKRNNRNISRTRIKIKNIIAFIKRFKILSDRYRNRRKRFLLRFNLICGIGNFDRSF
jgi:hypothetical protein